MKLRRLLFITLFLIAGAARADEVLQEITVNPGETMWSIANRYLKDPQKWPEIVKYNKLPTQDPTLALPGTKIKVPVLLIKEEFRNAQLVRMIPEVRYKRREESEWKAATPDMTLKYEDSLRTMQGGQARVLFPTKEEVQINENSLVVLRPERVLQEVQMESGDLRASHAKVIMPGGTVVNPRGGSSDFQAKVRDDKSSVVFVYKGEVDVTAKGQTVRVREGYGTHVPTAAAPTAPQPLPSFKDFNPSEMVMASTPVLEENRAKAAAPPKTANPFTPPAPEAAPASSPGGRSKSVVSQNIMVGYQVQLAQDAKFSPVLLDKMEKVGETFDIKKESIADGTYVMRIAFIDAFGVKGDWSAPTTVQKDTSPPEIVSLTPDNNQRFMGDESYCDIIGTVKDAAVVTVNGDLVFLTPTGRFTKFINLTPGKNKITVMARDTAGNETRVERIIDYTPTPTYKH
jgi:hypothetical protein